MNKPQMSIIYDTSNADDKLTGNIEFKGNNLEAKIFNFATKESEHIEGFVFEDNNGNEQLILVHYNSTNTNKSQICNLVKQKDNTYLGISRQYQLKAEFNLEKFQDFVKDCLNERNPYVLRKGEEGKFIQVVIN